MEPRREQAVKRRMSGYNCAQAVLCTYSDQCDLSEKELYQISEGLGGGLGCSLGTCGALNAAVMLAGLKYSSGDPCNLTRGTTMAIASAMTKKFQEQAGALRCRDLKGIDTGKMLCSCPDCVRIACDLAEAYLYKEED